MPRSVLMVEDDTGIRRVVGACLAGEGFTVAEADTGEEGLRLLARRNFDVVLLDLMLPGRDGSACAGRSAARAMRL